MAQGPPTWMSSGGIRPPVRSSGFLAQTGSGGLAMLYPTALGLILTLNSAAVGLGVHACKTIRNPDYRLSCIAQTTRQAALCTHVRNPDQRNACLFRSSRGQARCPRPGQRKPTHACHLRAWGQQLIALQPARPLPPAWWAGIAASGFGGSTTVEEGLQFTSNRLTP